MKTPEEFLSDNGFVTAAEIDRQALISSLLSEMEKGLKGESSSLMMIPTYVGVDGKIPQGAKAIVLDAGGTNFRGGIVSIPPQIEEKQNQPMPGTRGNVGEDEFYGLLPTRSSALTARQRSKKSAGAFHILRSRLPILMRSSFAGRKTSKRPPSSVRMSVPSFSSAQAGSRLPSSTTRSRLSLPRRLLREIRIIRPISGLFSERERTPLMSKRTRISSSFPAFPLEAR